MLLVILRVALTEHSKQLVLNIIPPCVALVEWMQNHQAVYLVFFHVTSPINISCLLHVEGELPVLLHHQELIGSLLKQ